MTMHKLNLPTLKNIPEKLEVEIEDIPDAKILLIKSGDTIHALSPRCTHYGAPLKGGVIEGGRITCPWHGACFNIATGDVEDAPALNALNKFDLIEKDDGVYIHASEADIKSGHRNPVLNFKSSVSEKERVVVVGGGSGTMGLIQALREKNYTGAITILSKEREIIDRPKLSKALIADPSKILLRTNEWLDEAGIEFLTDEVTSVDFGNKFVVTVSGKKVPYTKLVLATGGIPRTLPLPGFKGELRNIFTLRGVGDVQAILAGIDSVTTPATASSSNNDEEKKKKNIVIIGSSFIGMELGTALSSSHNVTIIGMESTPMERVLGKDVGQIIQRNLEKAGIRFILDASVEKATSSSSSPQVVNEVHLKDGSTIAADIVILGVGVRPATDFLLSNESITLEGDGSIRTDGGFVVDPSVLNLPGSDAGAGSGAGDVFAIGDIAKYPYTGPGGNGSYTRIEHWDVAQNAGRSAGRIIAHSHSSSRTSAGAGGTRAKSFIPIFWSAVGGQMRYAGNTVNGYDDVFIVKGKEEAKFAAYYFLGETVVAVATMGFDPVMAKVASLMRAGRMLKKSEIVNGADVLEV